MRFSVAIAIAIGIYLSKSSAAYCGMLLWYATRVSAGK